MRRSQFCEKNYRNRFGIGSVRVLDSESIGPSLGATDEEIKRTLPGDDILPYPTDETNHAVTIHSAAADIWPWLVQVGYHRGGWYSGAKWDKIMNKYVWQVNVPPEQRAELRPSVEKILPQFQHIKPGDIIPDGPPGTAFFTVEGLKLNRYLLLYSNSHFRYLGPGFLRGTDFEPYGAFSWVFFSRAAGS